MNLKCEAKPTQPFETLLSDPLAASESVKFEFGQALKIALIKVAIGIAKKTPQNPQTPPNTSMETIIAIGCKSRASENKTGTKMFPSIA